MSFADLLHGREFLCGWTERTDLLLCCKAGTDGQQATDTSPIVTGNQIPVQEGQGVTALDVINETGTATDTQQPCQSD